LNWCRYGPCCRETIREAAKLKRRHHPPRTPQQRLSALCKLSDIQRQALEELLQRSCDPVALLETVRRCQASLASLSGGQPQTKSKDPEAGRWILSRPARSSAR